jgi:exosortase/archaeosortase family protein
MTSVSLLRWPQEQVLTSGFAVGHLASNCKRQPRRLELLDQEVGMNSRKPTFADTSPIAHYCQEWPILLIFSLNTIALFLDHLFVPALANIKPALISAFLLALLFRRTSTTSTAAQFPVVISRWRVAVFCSCHLAVILVTCTLGRVGLFDTGDVAVSAPIAAVKYLILLPTIVLLPLQDWCRLERLYRAEWIAATIALLTVPSRLYTLLWPRYSSLLAHSIYAVAVPFVSGLRYVGGEFPTLTGPTLDTTITFACGGVLIVELFQLLFGMIVIVDWNELNLGRTLIGYFAGICLLLLANIFRIALLVIIGNRVSADLVVSQHLSAGWFVIAVTLVAYVMYVYPWMLNKEQARNYTPQVASTELSVIR